MIASNIMSRIGRKRGFIYAAIYTSVSSLIAAVSIYYGDFLFYCLSCFFAIGNGLAFTHQYRFAAAESVSEDMIPRAISVIMLAIGIFSALLGPNIAVYSQNLIPEHTFVGPYIALSFMTFLPVLSLIFYSPKNAIKSEKKIIAGRSYSRIVMARIDLVQL